MGIDISMDIVVYVRDVIRAPRLSKPIERTSVTTLNSERRLRNFVGSD
jgi:hypothetical protein